MLDAREIRCRVDSLERERFRGSRISMSGQVTCLEKSVYRPEIDPLINELIENDLLYGNERRRLRESVKRTRATRIFSRFSSLLASILRSEHLLKILSEE